MERKVLQHSVSIFNVYLQLGSIQITPLLSASRINTRQVFIRIYCCFQGCLTRLKIFPSFCEDILIGIFFLYLKILLIIASVAQAYINVIKFHNSRSVLIWFFPMEFLGKISIESTVSMLEFIRTG